MNSVLSAILLLFSITASAQLERDQVVKVFSKYNSTEFRGSGVLFHHHRVPYVLTSDHVVLHEARSINRALDEKGKVLNCQFVAADYGRGLALLRVMDAMDVDKLNAWQDWRVAAPRVGDATVMMGYPHQSASMVSSTRGTIADASRKTDLLIQVPHMTLIENGHGEFGMSGGLAKTPANELLGLVSHQIYSEIGRIQNDILLIPGSEIYNWLQNYFATSGANIELTQSIYQQLSSLPFFSTGHLTLTTYDNGRLGVREIHIFFASERLASLYGGNLGALQPVEDHLIANPDCILVVKGLRDQLTGRLLSPGSLFDFVRLTGNGNLEVHGTTSCMSAERR